MKAAGYLFTLLVVALAITLSTTAQQAEPQGQTTKAAETQPVRPEGAGGTYKIDPVHSSNWFRIRHLNVANFYGRFNKVEGSFVLDDANPTAGTLDVQVKVETIDTNNADRDKHLKSAEFFDAAQHPTIAFKSKAVTKLNERDYEVRGELTLRGVTRPLTVKLTRTGSGPGLRGEFRTGLETSFEIKRSEFGMTALMGGLGDEVLLTFSFEGVRQ